MIVSNTARRSLRSTLSSYLRQGRWRVLSDLALLLAAALWVIGTNSVDVAKMGLFGLPAILPVPWYAGLGLVLVSAGLLLAEETPSRWRLALHLLLLLVILFGTAPLVYVEPRYSWLYKHIGVTQYIATHGHLNGNVDIYQDWPALFTLAAWFDGVAGVASPLVYAAWAQLCFEIVYVVELSWALKALPLRPRERWLALFIFVLGNWIAQDYFSPQGFGFVLSLGVIGLALHWMVPGRPVRVVRYVENRLRRIIDWFCAHLGIPLRGAQISRDIINYARELDSGTFVVLLFVYFMLTAVHELSPYMVVVQLGALAVFGFVRPRLAIIGMLGVAFAYLAPHFGFVNQKYGLLSSVGNFFGNVQPPSSAYPSHGAASKLTARTAELLVAWVWFLACIGILRRLRQRRSATGIAILTFAPFLLLALVAYGNEGVLRVYLFSLPWAACLAATALCVKPFPARRLRWLVPTACLLITAGLFVDAFFGADYSNVMSPQDIATAEFLLEHTSPGPVMTIDTDFPEDVGSRYALYFNTFSLLETPFAEKPPPVGAAAVPFIETYLTFNDNNSEFPQYVVVTDSMIRYAEFYGLATLSQIRSFESAMDQAPNWQVIYRHQDNVIYELPAGL